MKCGGVCSDATAAVANFYKGYRCDHEGFVSLLVDTTPHHKCYGEFYGKCTNCGKLGPSGKTAYEAGRKFKEQTLKEFQLLENPILETHAKNTVNSVPDIRNCESMTTTQLMPIAEAKKKFGNRPTAFSPVFGMPYGAAVTNGNPYADFAASTPLTAAHLNQTYKQIQEALVATAPTEKPYWIIVSDEGHSSIPVKHFVKAEAEKEAQRLTELKPGITFTVFEAKSSLFTPKAETKKTEYAEPKLPHPFTYEYYYGGKPVWL